MASRIYATKADVRKATLEILVAIAVAVLAVVAALWFTRCETTEPEPEQAVLLAPTPVDVAKLEEIKDALGLR